MSQKSAVFDNTGVILGFYDSDISPVPNTVDTDNVLNITDDQWTMLINNQGKYIISGGALVSAPTPVISSDDLILYANQKQTSILDNEFDYTLQDNSATLNTKCDAISVTFLNSLGTWAILNSSTPSLTRVYYNLDGSAHTLTVNQLIEFLKAVGAHIQTSFDNCAAVVNSIKNSSVTTIVQINSYSW